MPFAAVNGIDVHYRLAGDGPRRPPPHFMITVRKGRHVSDIAPDHSRHIPSS